MKTIDITASEMNILRERIEELEQSRDYLNSQIEGARRKCFDLEKENRRLNDEIKILNRQSIAVAFYSLILASFAIGALAIFM